MAPESGRNKKVVFQVAIGDPTSNFVPPGHIGARILGLVGRREEPASRPPGQTHFWTTEKSRRARAKVERP